MNVIPRRIQDQVIQLRRKYVVESQDGDEGASYSGRDDRFRSRGDKFKNLGDRFESHKRQNSPDTSGPRSGGTYRPQSEYRRESRDYSREDGEHFQREGNQDAGKPEAAWVCLENACQKQWETLHEWADCLRDIGKQIFKWNRDTALVIEQRLVMRFCLWGLDKDAGRRVFERGPPPSLEKAVKEMYGLRRVDSTFVESHVCRGSWSSPEREYL
ncbi:hypothetical protein ElyMa_005254100 [Elysia marginata]|uniref:NR LBD domain-containing protein n=1 Tax=Elysia marginata TaxID=1093978 RepID=A0AAV4JY65_9GAST|nr:hypothetical protein ElyMa_005254100 [Elysia marginata]